MEGLLVPWLLPVAIIRYTKLSQAAKGNPPYTMPKGQQSWFYYVFRISCL
jgi:hypothetical protein